MPDVDATMLKADALPWWSLQKLEQLGIRTIEITPERDPRPLPAPCSPSRSRVPRQAVKKEPTRILGPGAAGLRRLPVRSSRLAAKDPSRWTSEADSSRSRSFPRTCPGVGGTTG
jgi:hypothetical protein